MSHTEISCRLGSSYGRTCARIRALFTRRGSRDQSRVPDGAHWLGVGALRLASFTPARPFGLPIPGGESGHGSYLLTLLTRGQPPTRVWSSAPARHRPESLGTLMPPATFPPLRPGVMGAKIVLLNCCGDALRGIFIFHTFGIQCPYVKKSPRISVRQGHGKPHCSVQA